MKNYSKPELCQVGSVPEIVLASGTFEQDNWPACQGLLSVLDVD